MERFDECWGEGMEGGVFESQQRTPGLFEVGKVQQAQVVSNARLPDIQEGGEAYNNRHVYKREGQERTKAAGRTA